MDGRRRRIFSQNRTAGPVMLSQASSLGTVGTLDGVSLGLSEHRVGPSGVEDRSIIASLSVGRSVGRLQALQSL